MSCSDELTKKLYNLRTRLVGCKQIIVMAKIVEGGSKTSWV